MYIYILFTRSNCCQPNWCGCFIVADISVLVWPALVPSFPLAPTVF